MISVILGWYNTERSDRTVSDSKKFFDVVFYICDTSAVLQHIRHIYSNKNY